MTGLHAPLALALGTFDGVHLGHRAIIETARAAVGPTGAVTAVTFWPHPLTVLDADGAPALLQGLDAREDALLNAGADEVLLLEFTSQLAQTSAESFVEDVLAPLGPVAVAVGANFTFGARGAGTPAVLTDLAKGRFEVLTSPIVAVNDQPVSSSVIRSLVLSGDVSAAGRLLGRDFSVRGEVVVGDRRGRLLGFPTANLTPTNDLVTPADGVYAGWLRRLDDPDGVQMPAAVSVGDNPTFGSTRRVEAYVLDADFDIYGVAVEVGFRQWLRGMVTFASVKELIAQMRQDVADTSTIMIRA